MTREEYQAAKTNGEIDTAPLSALGIEADELSSAPDEFQPLLEYLRTPRRTLSSAPTAPPRNLAEQFQFVEIAGEFHLYVWAGNAWRKAQLDAPAPTPPPTPELHAELRSLTINNGTSDTLGSFEMDFVPKMVIGTTYRNGDNARAWGIYMNTSSGDKKNAAAIPGDGNGDLAGGEFLGIATGSPGTYVKSMTVVDTTLQFHYANGSPSSITVDFWILGLSLT